MKCIDVGKTPFKGSVKDVEIEQLFCVKRLLTVTNLKQAILFKNPNNQNKFRKHLHFLEGIYQHQKNIHELAKINFLKKQQKKLESWSEKAEKAYQDVRLPELTITQLVYKRKSEKGLSSLCHEYRKPLFQEKQSKKLRTLCVPYCDETFITRMTSCLESDHITKKQDKYLTCQEKLLSKKSVNDKRFCELESTLQSYSGHKNKVGQCLYGPSIVTLYKQKTGFTLSTE